MADSVGQLIGQVSKSRTTSDLDQLVKKFIEFTPANGYEALCLDKGAVLIAAKYVDHYSQEHPNSTERDAFLDFFQKYGSHKGLRNGAVVMIPFHTIQRGRLSHEDVQYLADHLRREFGD